MSLRERLDQKRAERERKSKESGGEKGSQIAVSIVEKETSPITGKEETFSLNISPNEEQKAAIGLAAQGKSFVLTGPPGTGKTATSREMIRAILQSEEVQSSSHVFKSSSKHPETSTGIAVCAFTNAATGNIAKALYKDDVLKEQLSCNVLTFHALLEYSPVTYMDVDEKGEMVQKFKFEEQRTASNPLTIKVLIVEEGTTLGIDLWEKVWDALSPDTQIIYIGDINQLPPVFGQPILAHALHRLPVVELKTPYRFGDNVGIIDAAHDILKGNMPKENPEKGFQWMAKSATVTAFKMSQAVQQTIATWHKNGTFTPGEDMIITPYNKGDLGTIELNSAIAQYMGDQRQAVVHEVIAGFNKHYLAEGDVVLVKKMRGIITNITSNTGYMGQTPMAPSEGLLRTGVYVNKSASPEKPTMSYDELDLGAIMGDSLYSGNGNDEEGRKQQASHHVDVALDDGGVVTLRTAGDFGLQVFQLGYAITGHKAIGQEWPHVMVIMHHTHRTMIFREWIYTAITRARETVTLVAHEKLVQKAVENPRAKGDTLEDKIALFTERVEANAHIQVTK